MIATLIYMTPGALALLVSLGWYWKHRDMVRGWDA